MSESVNHRGSGSRRQWAVGRPKKACGQCKNQKVRCSGDRPVCKRCARLRHNCAYEPSAGQSKSTHVHAPMITADSQTTSFGSARQEHDHELSDIHHHVETTEAASIRTQVALPLYTRPSEEYYLGIPSALVSNLIEIYFINVYNASLLLHKPSFMEALTAKTARNHVVLSVCAFAANFYRDENGNAFLKDHGFMMEWADRAGKLVFQEVETPQEDNIVTFLNLALFFYSQGLWRRGIVHKGNATLLCKILGCSMERVGRDNLLESEIRRRRFWACYLMNCHSSEHADLAASEPSESELSLAMPWREEDYQVGIASQPRICLNSRQRNRGLYSELIRGFTLWVEVNNLIKKKPVSSTMDSRISAIHALDHRLSEWWSQLPDIFHLTPSTVPTVSSVILPKLLLLHAVYHQSLSALHSSIVPLFSWSPGDESWLSARQISAQVAFDHACTASDLFGAVLEHSPTTLSATPSFVSYAAYCGCAIQIPFLWCSEASVRERAHRNVGINVEMINVLAPYWKFSSLFDTYVRYLYRIHANHPTPIEDEPKKSNAANLTGFKFDVANANTTILGFNRVLWTKNGGYMCTGEEDLTDLGVDGDGSLRAPNMGEPLTPVINGNLHPTPPAQAYSEQGSFQDQERPETSVALNTYSTSSTSNWKNFLELYTASQGHSGQASFYPFDASLVGFDGEALDFSQFDLSPLGLDFSG